MNMVLAKNQKSVNSLRAIMAILKLNDNTDFQYPVNRKMQIYISILLSIAAVFLTD